MQLSLFDKSTDSPAPLDSRLGPPRHYPHGGEPVVLTKSRLLELVGDVQENARARVLTPDHLDRFLAAWHRTRRDAAERNWQMRWVEIQIDGGTVRRSHSPGAPVTILRYSYGYLTAFRGTADRADNPTEPDRARLQVFRPSPTSSNSLPDVLGADEFERHWQMVRSKKYFERELAEQGDDR